MIMFSDVPQVTEIKSLAKKVTGKTNIRQLELEKELQTKREEMQNTLEEMQIFAGRTEINQ